MMYQGALLLAAAEMLMGRDCICSIYTVHMLLHLHGLHEAHKADIGFFAFAI